MSGPLRITPWPLRGCRPGTESRSGGSGVHLAAQKSDSGYFSKAKKKKKKLPKSGPGNPGEGRGGRATTEPACSGDLQAGTVCPPSLEARAPHLLPVGLTTRMQRFQASR